MLCVTLAALCLCRVAGEVAIQWPEADADWRACQAAQAAHCHGRGLAHGLARLLLLAALPGQQLD